MQKPKFGELLSQNFPSLLLPPFCSTLHWFPYSPCQYTCSLVETIIIHMRSSIIIPGFFYGKEVLLLNPSHTRFVTHVLRMIHTLCLKNSLRRNGQLKEFISLKLRKEEGTVAIIKYDISFHKRHVFRKNGKASPYSSEDGQLKPAPHGQALVHGPYGWWSHKDVYAWSNLWILFLACTRVRRIWILRRSWWWLPSLIPSRWWRCVLYWGLYSIPR